MGARSLASLLIAGLIFGGCPTAEDDDDSAWGPGDDDDVADDDVSADDDEPHGCGCRIDGGRQRCWIVWLLLVVMLASRGRR